MSNPAYQGGGMHQQGGANANNPAAGSSGTPYAMQYAQGSGVPSYPPSEFTNDLLAVRNDPNCNSVAPTTAGQIHVGGGYSMPAPRQYGDASSDRAGPAPTYAPVLIDPSSLVPAAAAHYYRSVQQQQQSQPQQPQQLQQSVYHSQQPSQPHSHLHHHQQQYAGQPQAIGAHFAGTHDPAAYAPVDHARAAPYASDLHPSTTRLSNAVTTDSSPRSVPMSTYPTSMGALQFPGTPTHAPPPPAAPSATISLNPTYGPYDHDDQVALYNPGPLYAPPSASTPPGALRATQHVPSQVAANTVDALQYSQLATSSPMVPPAAMQVLPGAPIMDANTIAAAGGIPPGYVTVPASSLIPAKKARAARACLQCRKRKIKCSGTEPCQHCQDFELLCEYKEPLKRGPKAGKLNAVKNGTGQPIVSLFQPASVLDTHVPLTSSVTRPSTDADVDEIANNLALLVTLDANGTPRGFSNYGNSSGYHLLKGLPSNTNLDGVNVFFSQIAVQHVTMNEILRHRVWFPRRDLLELLLNVYQERVHHWWPMLSRRTLNESVAYVDRALTDPANEACTAEFNRHALLIYAALAMPAAMWELQHQICVAVPYSRIMSAHGKRLLANVCSSAANHLTDAQAALLLAIFDLGIPSGNNWLTSGMGFRIALSLGLNLDQRAVMPTTTWTGLGRRGGGGGTDTHAERRELSPELVKLAQHAPGVPSRILTFLVVFIMDRLGAAAGGRPIMVHEEDCVLDLDAIKDTDDNRAKYADEQDLLLPPTSYFPYYLAWSEIVGKVLRVANSFYRRKQLSAKLLPELHAALTQFRSGIPQELVFDPAAFHTLDGAPPSTATLESAVLTMGYTQTIIYMYRPLVTMVIAATLHQNEAEGDETPPPGVSPLAADDPFMHARARLRAHVVTHTTTPTAPTSKSKSSSSTAPTSSTLSPAPPALYPQYVAILETCVSSIAQVFSAIRPFMHLYFSTMLHQMGSVISAGRVIVAGGGNAVLVRDALRELLVVLDRLLPTVPLALHTYHTCRMQLDQLDAVIAAEGGEPAAPLPAPSAAADPERAAARHARTDRALALLMDDIAEYARDVPKLAGVYVAPAKNAYQGPAVVDAGPAMAAAAATRPRDLMPLPAFPHSFGDWAMQVVPDGLDLPFVAPPPPPPGSPSI
ncbi:hypothetical protein AMAG_14491 [Allomyces macrogynus ATCC 38327]|uniref:Zn(2)-C6 fungal-type domain-containing protein n=1 Tax=Allomyces macrogynus (strain ATCC 38327) TaxID=578462 RepID=A0A0L0T6M9_ALLM3|nr:hypothetical protein AMAG_14491 [Allomyces macrogynus ATCC 38327]|eukprot:KNE70351.1 hypothetical protein AMAG_14491 [Allomyces macrogynus ATCC 38327]